MIFGFDRHTHKVKKKAKAKTKKWAYIRLKVSRIAKEASDRMKRQPPEREEIFANHISDKELISKGTQLQKQQQQQCDWKIGKEWSKYFSKKDIERHTVNRYTKRYSTSLIRKIKIKITRYHLTSIRTHACMHAKLLQSCPTLCNPMDYSPPGSSVHGILQARILEWVAISLSRGSSPSRDQTCTS